MEVYDAFVSYSHAKDKPIAAALQSVIQTLGKPWYRPRALRVFRGDTPLSATPSLWPSIEQALSQSRFLILLASPEAAASHWVNKEIAYWLEHNSVDTLLIAVTDGELSWDNTIGDFIWRAGMPLPPALTGRFAAEPRWADLRAYRGGVDTRDSRFIEFGADFAAAIHGTPKEELLSQEVGQQRRALRLAWGAAGLLLALAVVAAWCWMGALRNERLAIEQRQLAREQRDRAVEAVRLATEHRNETERERGRAERTLEAATTTANSLVSELAREFRARADLPADLVRRILDRAQDLQRQLTESGEATPALRRGEAVTLLELVDTLLALGDTKAALAAAERARAIAAELASADAGNTQWQSDLSISHNRIGDVLVAAGRREDALAEYRRSLAIRAKLAAADPDNPGWQRGLSVIHNRIGNLLMAVGRREEALAEDRKSLAIHEKLAAADPGNTQWQADLALSLYNVSSASEPAAARAMLRRAIMIIDTLAANGRLTKAQAEWPRMMHDALAMLPPEQAGAQ